MGNSSSLPCMRRLNSCCHCDCCDEPKPRTFTNAAMTSNPLNARLATEPSTDATDCKSNILSDAMA